MENDKSAFRTIHISKVGLLSAKDTEIDIHNVFIQVDLTMVQEPVHKEGGKMFVLSIGNTNTSGI